MSKLNNLKLIIAEKLSEIENTCKKLGLTMPNITFIARDPENDNMSIVVTNEDNIDNAFSVAKKLEKEGYLG